MVSASSVKALAESLRPLTRNPSQAAIFCDIDGTLAPIVARPEDSRVREEVAALLSRLGSRYAMVACVSGRSVAEARLLVGVDAIAYVGSHGAEVLRAGAEQPELVEAFASWEGAVRDFVKERENERELGLLGIRLEDKGPIKALHWRGSPDEPAAETVLQGVAREAVAAGLDIHWGRKVLEVRPPVPVDKGRGIRSLMNAGPVRAALYGGDDATDLDAFDALDNLTAEGRLDAAVRVGVRSAEGPEAIVSRADVVVEGVPGFNEVLIALAEAG